MRSIIFVIDDSSGSASGDEMTAIDAFNTALQVDGQWVMAAGIAAPGRSERKNDPLGIRGEAR